MDRRISVGLRALGPLPYAGLANFGSATFSQAAVTGDGHAGTITDPAWTATPITLAENGLGGFDGRLRPAPIAATTGAVLGDPRHRALEGQTRLQRVNNLSRTIS